MCMEPNPKAETIAMTTNTQPITIMMVLNIFMGVIVWNGFLNDWLWRKATVGGRSAAPFFC